MAFIAVIGAGVVGLSTALKIQEKGYMVTIVSEIFPDDPKSIRFTSHWAGAHHVSLAGDDVRQQKMDRMTFDIMWKMSEAPESEQCFLRLPQTEYYYEESVGPSPLEFMPDFRYLNKDELRPGSACGVSFTTLTIDIPVYLKFLFSLFISRGGKIQRASIQHIAQVTEGAYTQGQYPDAIIVCAGIGARFLGGIEDKDVYPIRGQTVLLDAPQVKFGRTMRSSGDVWTYIIPRRSGNVIVGGSKVADDWYPSPRPETTKDILERALKLCPELSPTYTDDTGMAPSIKDIESKIIYEGCGLRPGRKGGIRLDTNVVKTVSGCVTPVIYNYGHGEYGYISSWGAASMVLELLENVLSRADSH